MRITTSMILYIYIYIFIYIYIDSDILFDITHGNLWYNNHSKT